MPDSPPLKAELAYVYSGYISKMDGAVAVPGPKSLRPLQNVTLLTAAATRPVGNGSQRQSAPVARELQPWVTDGKGLINPYRKGGARTLDRSRRFILPPPELLLQAWGHAGEEGPKKLAETLQNKIEGVELTKQLVSKSQLAPPNPSSTSADEKAYAEFYKALPDDKKLNVYVLPKVRAVVLAFANPALLNATVALHRPDGSSVEVQVASYDGALGAVVCGDEESLRPGMYRIVVKPRAFPGLWHAGTKQNRSYELKEAIRFGIRNFAGEFDVVACDPISVEEALLVQYASVYSDPIAKAKHEALYPDQKPEYVGARDAKDSTPRAWFDRAKVTQAKTAMTLKVVNGGLKPRQLANMIYEGVGANEVPALRAAKKSVDLAFSLKENYTKWNELYAKLPFRSRSLPKIDYQEAKRDLGLLLGFTRITEDKLEVIRKIDDLKAPLIKSVLADEQVLVQRSVAKTIQDKAWDSAPKVVGKIGDVLSLVELMVLAYEAEQKEHAAKLAQERFQKMAATVKTQLGGAPSREAIGNLELARVHSNLLTDQAGAAEVKATLTMLSQLIAFTCPIAKVLIDSVVLVSEFWGERIVPAIEWIDREIFQGDMQETRHIREELAALYSASATNSALFNSRPDHPEEVQFRMRADLVGGLFALLTRAALGAKTDADYLANVKKYQVKEYIEKVLLGDGWPFSPSTLGPTPDQAWILGKGHVDAPPAPRADPHPNRPALKKEERIAPHLQDQEEIAQKLYAASLGIQKTFPIHTMESESVEALAKAFQTHWPELRDGSVEYTCVYTRPRGSTDDKDWKPLDSKGARRAEDLPILSPLDQVRILIVLKNKIPDGQYPMYPVSVQLERVDQHRVKGPVYRDSLRRLGPELLESEKARFADRLGCVVKPFYGFGKDMHPGVKPLVLERFDETRRSAPEMRLPRGKPQGSPLVETRDLISELAKQDNAAMLKDMRYAFVISLLGSYSTSLRVNLGGAGGTKSALDVIRVEMGADPLQQAMSRDAAFLRHLGEKKVLPELFPRSKGGKSVPSQVGPIYARLGRGPFLMADVGTGRRVVFHRFDWNRPVELVIPVYHADINSKLWEAEGLDWKKVKSKLYLENGRITGPSYDTELEYVGTIEETAVPGGKALESKISLQLDPTAQASMSEGLRAWVRLLQVPPFTGEYRRGLQMGDEAGRLAKGHLFAAYVRLSYVAPNGESVDGLRPFGRMDDFIISVGGFNTAAKSGLDVTPIGEFEFPGPTDFTADVPWARGAQLDLERVKEWVVDHPRALNAVEALDPKAVAAIPAD